jgi:hypothetical protein
MKLFDDSHSLSCFIHLLHLLPILAYTNQIKEIVTSEVHHVISTTNIYLDRMARGVEYREFRWREERNSSREMSSGETIRRTEFCGPRIVKLSVGTHLVKGKARFVSVLNQPQFHGKVGG